MKENEEKTSKKADTELRTSWKLTMGYSDDTAAVVGPTLCPSQWDKDDCEVVHAHPRGPGMTAVTAVQLFLEKHATQHVVSEDETFTVLVAVDDSSWMTFHRTAKPVWHFEPLSVECSACGGAGFLYWDDDINEPCDTCDGDGKVFR